MKIIDKQDLKLLKSRDKVLIKCYICNKSFNALKHEVQSVLAGGSRKNRLKYCSRPCQNEARYTGKRIECVYCGDIFYRQIKKIKKQNFCSQSCAASFNNSIRKRSVKEKNKIRKQKIKKRHFCVCGSKKSHDAQFCIKCRRTTDIKNVLKKTLKEKTGKGNARVKYSMVRKIASRVLELSNIKKECKICEFNICVEVCHIKPIHKFKEADLLSKINSITNLIYLCPNHHKMLDKKIIIFK